MKDIDLRHIVLSGPLGFDIQSYVNTHIPLLEPTEYLSDKLHKYSTDAARVDYDSKILPAYHVALARARLAFKDGNIVHKLDKEVSDKIKNTIIEGIPEEIPAIFKQPFIIESHKLGKCLFGDVDSIVGYYSEIEINPELTKMQLTSEERKIIDEINNKNKLNIIFHTVNKIDDNYYLTLNNFNSIISKKEAEIVKKNINGDIDVVDITTHYSGFIYLGQNTFRWKPNLEKTDWKFLRIDYEKNVIIQKGYCRICPHNKVCDKYDKYSLGEFYSFCFEGICDNIMSYITIFNYMMLADNKPITVQDKHNIVKQAKLSRKGKITERKENWIIRHLYLNKANIKYDKNIEHEKLQKEGYVLKETRVRGHLRHQAYGTAWSQHKWIYIENFVSSKWVKNGDIKVIVKYE
jgi:hypothetical protein